MNYTYYKEKICNNNKIRHKFKLTIFLNGDKISKYENLFSFLCSAKAEPLSPKGGEINEKL